MLGIGQGCGGKLTAILMVVGGFSLVPCRGARAQYQPVFSGPAYDLSTENGYRDPGETFSSYPILSHALDAVGIGTIHKYAFGADLGERAVRWTSDGLVSELGNLGTDGDGTTMMRVFGTNDVGVAVGYGKRYESGTKKGDRAVRWDASGTATELGGLGISEFGSVARAYARVVNNVGTVAGDSDKYDEAGKYLGHRAVRWDASSTNPIELEDLGTNSVGVTYTGPIAINDAGIIVGTAEKYEAGGFKGYRAVRWDASGHITEMEAVEMNSAVPRNYAVAINNTGTSVGYASDGGGSIYHGNKAVRWDASGTATVLGNIGNPGTRRILAAAVDINELGTAVGFVDKYDGDTFLGERAVRWDALGTEATELGTLGTSGSGSTIAMALGINDGGIAVGWSNTYDDLGRRTGIHATMWGLDGDAIDLNSLIDPASGWLTLTRASSISEEDWVTGVGYYDPDGPGPLGYYTRMFLMQVPEPGTMGLMLCAGLVTLVRRR